MLVHWANTDRGLSSVVAVSLADAAGLKEIKEILVDLRCKQY